MADAPGSQLAAALAAFQAELPAVEKNRTGEVSGTSKTGKPYSYTYKYADLADVSIVVLKAIGKHGLSFTSRPTTIEGRFGLAYSLLHSSGERLDGFFELRDDADIQRVGGRITYARRYCLCAVTGVAAEEDTDARNDGHAGAQAARKPRPQPRAAAGHPEVDEHGAATLAEQTRMVTGPVPGTERLDGTPADDPWLSVDANGERRPPGKLPKPIGEQPPKPARRRPVAAEKPAPAAGEQAKRLPHVGAIMGHFGRLGVADRTQRLNVTARLAGLETVGSSNDLTEDQAKAVADALSRCKDSAALVALMAERELAAAEGA